MGEMPQRDSWEHWAATSASVSPHRMRRSEWPTMHQEQSRSLSIAAEIWPVKAPPSSVLTVWAPTWANDLSNAMALLTPRRAVKGGHMTTSTLDFQHFSSRSMTCWASLTASA